MSRGYNLVKNSFVFLIGNFASKLLVFFLLPLYTHYLSNSVYGEFDIYTNILAIVYCIVSFQSIEVIYRYIQDCKSNEDYKNVISNALLLSILGIIGYSIIMVMSYVFYGFNYWFVFILYTSSNILSQFCQQCIRGMNKGVLYSVTGVIATFVQVSFNILFIAIFHWGGVSILWAHVVTFIAIIIIILFKFNIFRYFDIHSISLSTLKEQIRYGIPLMPNALCLWGISSLGRYLLLFFYTTAAVGILAFSSKFSLLLGVVNSVFFLAWQQSVISEYEAEDRDNFASKIFHKFAKLQISGITVLLPIIKILIYTIMGSTYIEGWLYVPLFFIGIMFNAYANFVSMGFFGAKKTTSVFLASFGGIVIYLIIGLIGAKYLYIWGVGLAYILSQFVYFLIMRRKGYKYLAVKIEYNKLMPVIISLIVSIFLYYTASNLYLLTTISVVFFAISFFYNKELVNRIVTTLKHRK